MIVPASGSSVVRAQADAPAEPIQPPLDPSWPPPSQSVEVTAPARDQPGPIDGDTPLYRYDPVRGAVLSREPPANRDITLRERLGLGRSDIADKDDEERPRYPRLHDDPLARSPVPPAKRDRLLFPPISNLAFEHNGELKEDADDARDDVLTRRSNDDVTTPGPDTANFPNSPFTFGSPFFNGGTQPSLELLLDHTRPFDVLLEHNFGLTGIQDTFGESVYEFSDQWALQRQVFKDFAVFTHGFLNSASLPRLPIFQRHIEQAPPTVVVVGGGFLGNLSRRLAVFGSYNAGLAADSPRIIGLLGFAVALSVAIAGVHVRAIDQVDRGLQQATVEIDIVKSRFRSDGEAMCLALADSRGWTVATDDRKAIQVAAGAGLTVISCPQIVKAWAHATRPEQAVIVQVLTDIETLAHFRPHATMPGSSWWFRHRPAP